MKKFFVSLLLLTLTGCVTVRESDDYAAYVAVVHDGKGNIGARASACTAAAIDRIELYAVENRESKLGAPLSTYTALLQQGFFSVGLEAKSSSSWSVPKVPDLKPGQLYAVQAFVESEKPYRVKPAYFRPSELKAQKPFAYVTDSSSKGVGRKTLASRTCR